MGRKKVDYLESFSNVTSLKKSKELETARARIEELEKIRQQLEEQLKNSVTESFFEVHDVSLDKIEVNPNQPRKSFFDVVEMRNLLLTQGQRQPIILVNIPGHDKYMIFDGERRYRASIMLELKTIKAFFIPYNPDTFDLDVLITALNRKEINALDEAESLIKIIQRSLTLKPLEIANKLSAFISFLRRQKKLEYLSGLATDFEKREFYSQNIGFRNEEESRICLDIIDLGRSPISVSSNNFPLLKLTEDLKIGIREYGLNDNIAMSLNLISSNSKKLQGKISESDSLKIRQDLMSEIIEQKLSIRSAKKLINQRISKILGVETQPSNQTFSYLDRINIDKLSDQERMDLLSKLENLVSILKN
ncbi:MAG: ParB/RepB/Spo0J family partition protein [Xenococcaceae cyanobacterium MO_188.B19]|nr:ParB/RepB/Spo0J family partition protein [Xenococcaceae cyanobacterium MO_188.B19]